MNVDRSVGHLVVDSSPIFEAILRDQRRHHESQLHERDDDQLSCSIHDSTSGVYWPAYLGKDDL